MIIANWINNFETDSVNDVFNNNLKTVPAKLLQCSKQVEKDIAGIDTMKLSPTRPYLNKKIKAISNSMLTPKDELNKTHNMTFTSNFGIKSPRPQNDAILA